MNALASDDDDGECRDPPPPEACGAPERNAITSACNPANISNVSKAALKSTSANRDSVSESLANNPATATPARQLPDPACLRCAGGLGVLI